jgi:hypothetical protein
MNQGGRRSRAPTSIDDGLMMMVVIDDGYSARGEGRGGLQKAG